MVKLLLLFSVDLSTLTGGPFDQLGLELRVLGVQIAVRLHVLTGDIQ